MIQLEHIQKRYDKRVVLDVEKLTIRAGERYALLGANGSGKSTLLSILAGVCKPEMGVVRSSIHPGESAYLPQIPYAFDLSVLQSVMLPLGSGRIAKEQAMAALDRVGLTHLANAKANKMSGGETQRMALARVLAKPYKLLLLDEPTSATDIAANDLIESALLEYCGEHKCTLVVCTHAPSQARRLGTQAVFLNDGHIAEQGSAEEVLLSPKSASVKNFLQHWLIDGGKNM